jgi:2-dehydro-3-deoxyphosphogluconate aldolase/(4S)-4-hydroxy-2-oxoglutarate aldolase
MAASLCGRSGCETAGVTRPDLPPAVTDVRVIAILRGLPQAQTVAVARALGAAGVRAIEVTIDSPGAFDAIAQIAALEDVTAGAGTVLTIAEAERALAAGAEFLIAPVVDVELIAWATAHGVPAMPGAMTPTEAATAWNAGAAAVKLFPAGSLGPGFVRAVRAPLPQIPLIPTGGVRVEDVVPYLEAGALAVALGSELAAGGDPDEAGRRARAIVASIAAMA